jgi:hypothetical protein
MKSCVGATPKVATVSALPLTPGAATAIAMSGAFSS